MAPKALIVPGLNGSGEGHWQSWWLRDHPGSAMLVAQAEWDRPDADQWLFNLVAAIAANPGAILVAHSLGSILVARLADHPIARLVGGAILVAPADIGRTQALHRRSFDFGVMPARALSFPSLLVASRDDIYLSFNRALDLGAALGSTIVDLGYAGHINIASGYGRWPAGYAMASRLTAELPQKTVAGRSG
jgi:predicted alpha/beta hydrolase family esterase